MISVIVPVFNEAATIREILRRIAGVPIPKEIIVVDDGSTDGTAEILQDIGDALRTLSEPPSLCALCLEAPLPRAQPWQGGSDPYRLDRGLRGCGHHPGR